MQRGHAPQPGEISDSGITQGEYGETDKLPPESVNLTATAH